MLTPSTLDALVRSALNEDAPWGDITSAAVIDAGHVSTAVIVAREPGVMACGAILDATFRAAGAEQPVKVLYDDGSTFAAGSELATITATTRSLLLGERVALNLLQRACGVAATTRQYVDAVADTNARIADTRKTTPGLRALEKAAVLCGGGHNHRFSLSDAVMVKDNHIAIWRNNGLSIAEGLVTVQQSVGHTTHIEVEVDDLTTLDEVIASGIAHTILLDNFSRSDIERAMQKIDGQSTVEVSGGVNLSTVREIALLGVDVISVGALTHSVRAVDIAMEITAQ